MKGRKDIGNKGGIERKAERGGKEKEEEKGEGKGEVRGLEYGRGNGIILRKI